MTERAKQTAGPGRWTWLADIACAMVICSVIVLAAAATERHTTFVQSQATRATAALDNALAMPPDAPPPASVTQVRLSAGRHAFLPSLTARTQRAPAQFSALDDKTVYDIVIAHQTMALGTRQTGVVPTYNAPTERVARHASARAFAIIRRTPHEFWVAVSPLAQLPALPWLAVVGACSLGLLIGSLAPRLAIRASNHGGHAPAAMVVALAIAIVAMPAVAQRLWLAAGLVFAVAMVGGVLHGRGVSQRFWQALGTHRQAYQFIAPTMLAMLIIVGVPFMIGLGLGFFDHAQGSWRFVGLRNFAAILFGDPQAGIAPLAFWMVLGVTVLWTVVNVILAVALGVGLALILSQPWFAGQKLFRMLLILPWAIPNYITALIWKGMFAGEYGAINALLAGLGVDRVHWFSQWATAFFANVATNTWLGFPFMMVVAIGALQSIPSDLYEAAAVDGATSWQRFWHISLPHLRPAMGPAIALGSIWTFNMFAVIYLVSDGAPGGSTNILVTDAYKWAFERGERYGLAAAYATLIFVILLLWTWARNRRVVNREAA